MAAPVLREVQSHTLLGQEPLASLKAAFSSDTRPAPATRAGKVSRLYPPNEGSLAGSGLH